MTVTNPAPAPFATCIITTDSGSITVPCEPIDDGMAITPTFGMDEDGNSLLGGTFIITHRQTGTMLSDGPGCIECCRSAGKALVATGLDWSTFTKENSAEITASWSAEVRKAVAEARTVNWSCDAEDCDPWPDTADGKREPCGACGQTSGHASFCIHAVIPMVARENARVERARSARERSAGGVA